MHGLGKLACEIQVWRARFAPYQVGIGGVGNCPGNGLVKSATGFVKTLAGALARAEWLVVFVIIRGQEISCFGIGACDDERWHTADVSRHTCGNQFLHGFLCWHQHLATHVAALLDGSQLVFPVHATRARADHGLH
jgi:hypothetical protein